MIQLIKYIDGDKGDDSNDGTKLKPWKTFDKIENNTNIILLTIFDQPLVLKDKKNIKISGSPVAIEQLVSKLYQIPNSTNKYTPLKLQKPTYEIKQNPQTQIQGDIGTILDSWYDNKKEEDIENKIIETRKYTAGATTLNLVNCENIIIEFLSISTSYYKNFVCGGTYKAGIRIINCINCVVRGCEVFLFNKMGENMDNYYYLNSYRFMCGIDGGMGNRFINNNVYNSGGITISGTDNIISHNLVMNSLKDGIIISNNNNLCCNNLILFNRYYEFKSNYAMINIKGNNIHLYNNIMVLCSDKNTLYINTDISGIVIDEPDDPNIKNYDSIFIKNNLINIASLFGIVSNISINNLIIDKNSIAPCPATNKFIQNIKILTGNNIILTNNISYNYDIFKADNTTFNFIPNNNSVSLDPTKTNIFANNYSCITNNFITF